MFRRYPGARYDYTSPFLVDHSPNDLIQDDNQSDIISQSEAGDDSLPLAQKVEQLEAEVARLKADNQSAIAELHKRRKTQKQDMDESEIRSRWLSFSYVVENWATNTFQIDAKEDAEAQRETITKWMINELRYNAFLQKNLIFRSPTQLEFLIPAVQQAHVWSFCSNHIFNSQSGNLKHQFAAQASSAYNQLCRFFHDSITNDVKNDTHSSEDSGDDIRDLRKEYGQEYHNWRAETAGLLHRNPSFTNNLEKQVQSLCHKLGKEFDIEPTAAATTQLPGIKNIIEGALELDLLFQEQRNEYYVDSTGIRGSSIGFSPDKMEVLVGGTTVQAGEPLQLVIKPALIKTQKGITKVLVPAKVCTRAEIASRLRSVR